MGGPGHGRVLDESGGLVAWWGPFTHLVICGLGWPNPTLGISRWQKMNSPTADPILAVIERWWGPYLQPFLNWSRMSYHFVNFLNTINADLGGAELAAAPIPDYDDFSNPEVDVGWFGPDGDNMHLTAHLTALNVDPRANIELLKRKSVPGQPNRAVLLLDRYQGWYAQLSNLKLPRRSLAMAGELTLSLSRWDGSANTDSRANPKDGFGGNIDGISSVVNEGYKNGGPGPVPKFSSDRTSGVVGCNW